MLLICFGYYRNEQLFLYISLLRIKHTLAWHSTQETKTTYYKTRLFCILPMNSSERYSMVCAPVRRKSPRAGIIDRTGAQTMLYLTCTMTSSLDFAHYGVSRAKDSVSVDCGTSYHSYGPDSLLDLLVSPDFRMNSVWNKCCASIRIILCIARILF